MKAAKELNFVERIYEIEEWLLINQLGNKVIYIIGGLLFAALFIVLMAKKYKVPIVVGYVFLGILLSVDLVEKLPFLSVGQKAWYAFVIGSLDYIPQLALAFIAFTIGSELSIKIFKNLGKNIVYIVLLEAFGSFILVTLTLYTIGKPLYLALLLGAIASATAPAATVMVLQEYNAKGLLTSMILAIVGIDDAVALIIFSLVEPLALILYSGTGDLALTNILVVPLVEIIGSIVIGLIIGYISQRFMNGLEDKTKMILTLGTTVVGSSALAILGHLSPLITNMAVGFAYRNFAKRNLGIAEYLDTLTVPLYAMFFILAGTEIEFSSLGSSSFLIIALTYTLARIVGKIGGASLGAWLGNAPSKIKKYVGLGLLPQSGVAIALAYTVQSDFANAPQVGLLVFNTLLFTAALTEVFGPLATKYAIVQAGEAHDYEQAQEK
ncbi:Kef-type K+ transport system, membrane component [Halobacteroides halobius DSM 5150]|uniref:Kef-type K+ transport system, membrane component n=1 Tax=Halobacteroides halobius (strain ATCC 35273 / DSM 5150 / MD-1) TaxID=748449 RepID=L0K9E7_HALHC|nr:cation:proton antiporter [Halobacteroides halobius]AGB40733.1 Kef-type K+ transport system, membrane component [Halobacteroides halobius DSM 5150]